MRPITIRDAFLIFGYTKASAKPAAVRERKMILITHNSIQTAASQTVRRVFAVIAILRLKITIFQTHLFIHLQNLFYAIIYRKEFEKWISCKA